MLFPSHFSSDSDQKSYRYAMTAYPFYFGLKLTKKKKCNTQWTDEERKMRVEQS